MRLEPASLPKRSGTDISVNALLGRFMNERAALTHSAKAGPELPVWSLGSVGALHRRSIYNDVR